MRRGRRGRGSIGSPRGRAKRSASLVEEEAAEDNGFSVPPPPPKRARTAPVAATVLKDGDGEGLGDDVGVQRKPQKEVISLDDDDDDDEDELDLDVEIGGDKGKAKITQEVATQVLSDSPSSSEASLGKDAEGKGKDKGKDKGKEKEKEREKGKALEFQRTSTSDDFFSLSSRAPPYVDFEKETAEQDSSSDSDSDSDLDYKNRRKYAKKKDDFMLPPQVESIVFNDLEEVEDDDDDDNDDDDDEIDLMKDQGSGKKTGEISSLGRLAAGDKEKGREKSLVKPLIDDTELFTVPAVSSTMSKELREILNKPIAAPTTQSRFVDLDDDGYKPDLSLLSRAPSMSSEADADGTPLILFVSRKEDPRKPFPPEDTELGQKYWKPLKFKVFLGKSLATLFEVLKRTLANEGIQSDVILKYKGVKLYSRAIPKTLNMQNGDQLEFSNENLEEYLAQKQKEEEEQRRLREEEEIRRIEREALMKADQTLSTADSGGVNLKVKFADGTVEKVRVKKTSTVESIRGHLGKKKGLDSERIVLKLDGDTVDDEETIESLGLEDDDLLDAVVR